MTPDEVVKDEISKLLDRYMCGKCKINIEGNAKTDCRCIPYEQLIIALIRKVKVENILRLTKERPKKIKWSFVVFVETQLRNCNQLNTKSRGGWR
jgi:hypothetical protein